MSLGVADGRNNPIVPVWVHDSHASAHVAGGVRAAPGAMKGEGSKQLLETQEKVCFPSVLSSTGFCFSTAPQNLSLSSSTKITHELSQLQPYIRPAPSE